MGRLYALTVLQLSLSLLQSARKARTPAYRSADQWPRSGAGAMSAHGWFWLLQVAHAERASNQRG